MHVSSYHFSAFLVLTENLQQTNLLLGDTGPPVGQDPGEDAHFGQPKLKSVQVKRVTNLRMDPNFCFGQTSLEQMKSLQIQKASFFFLLIVNSRCHEF